MALIKGKQLSQNSVSLNRLALASEAEVLVANASGQLTAVSMSGDVAVVASGQTTVQANAITASKVSDGAITFAKLNASGISSDLSSSATATELARADAAKTYADGRYTAATQYADSVAQGLDVKDSVAIATTAALEACTYANGSSGVGATLTKNANGAFPQIEGQTLSTVGDRILVKNQGTAAQNGIYKLTTVGDGSNAWVLTRDTDADTSAKLNAGAFTFIEKGTTNADTGWVCTTDGAITIGTTALAFSQFSGGGTVTAGTGLSKTGNQLDLDLHSLTDVASAIAQDSIAIIDGSDSNNLKKTTMVSLATGLAVAMAGGGITSQGGGIISAPRMASGDQFETPSATSNDGDTSGVTIAAAPAGMVNVVVNGIMQELGQQIIVLY
mgnify:CR=1 FL=1